MTPTPEVKQAVKLLLERIRRLSYETANPGMFAVAVGELYGSFDHNPDKFIEELKDDRA